MTAIACQPAVPGRAIAISIALHAAALLLLPGLAKESRRLDLPPIIASLRSVVAPQPTTLATQVASVAEHSPAPTAEPRVMPRLSQSQPAREDHGSPPFPLFHPAEAPVAAVQTAPSSERPIREESVSAPISPSPAPKMAPASPPSPPENVALDDYGRALSELLARQQQYPRLAALRGWEGEVRLRLKVARKGNLVAVQVEHSSGHEVLDQHALQLIQAAALPAPPDGLGEREIQVVVPVHYKLQRPT